MKEINEERSLILENLRRKIRGELECFSCGITDFPFSCNLCGKLGHCGKQCTRNKSEPKIIAFSVRDQESTSCNMHSKTLIINGHRVTALLDTGSSSCFLKESAYQNLELNILPYKTNLYLSDSTQPVDLLVGRPFLDLPHIAYARIGAELRIGYVKEENKKQTQELS
ncbi:hypothetical protein NPIL_585121 [Nephila pilipes]|uniref:CCHC-type domain-containing protein n=1 Tax=Nephila pilipes TaxID=299642 RepID=A0A8X6UIH1_NEPPI|nr:hypothetical protein NPIL_585121 [Nephila pilipes]